MKVCDRRKIRKWGNGHLIQRFAPEGIRNGNGIISRRKIGDSGCCAVITPPVRHRTIGVSNVCRSATLRIIAVGLYGLGHHRDFTATLADDGRTFISTAVGIRNCQVIGPRAQVRKGRILIGRNYQGSQISPQRYHSACTCVPAHTSQRYPSVHCSCGSFPRGTAGQRQQFGFRNHGGIPGCAPIFIRCQHVIRSSQQSGSRRAIG